MIERAVAVVAGLLVAGCASTTGTSSDGAGQSWTSTISNVSFLSPKGSKATLISELKPGPYEASPLAIGEEKDLAQRRGEGLGFVRSALVEQYLTDVRAALLTASGVTGVPGQVRILANPAFSAYSTADGNVYVSMGWLEYLENADEVAAILAHETSHVLLKHHSADLLGDLQHRAQALHELAVTTKTSLSTSKTVSKSDADALSKEQIAADVTDKLALPAWSRRQEREADLLGVDLLVRAKYSPSAMITMLEKLQAWEKRNEESDAAFEKRLEQTVQKSPGEAVKLGYQRLVDAISESHPKTDERLDDTAAYLDHHYGDLKSPDPNVTSWKRVASRPDVAEVMRNYDRAFSARTLLDQGKPQQAYPLAKQAVTGRTATDAYPSWVLARTAASLGRQREAIEALRHALTSREPVPQIYEEMIFAYERVGNINAALLWTDKASATFGEAPRWTPTKIRLLRKAGRTSEATALTLKCSVDTPEWRRQCQEANTAPAGQRQH